MIAYKNLSGISGILAYELSEEAIIIRFSDGSEYMYDKQNCGDRHISKMKELAKNGAGLTTYINQHVRHCYSKKLK